MHLAIGLIFGLLVGTLLGLLGAGGSILTVPALTYALGFTPKAAIAAGLFVVALSSGYGGFLSFRKKQVDLKAIGLFLPSSILFSFFGARVARFISGEVQLIIFAVLMILAAFFMITKKSEYSSPRKSGSGRLALVVGTGSVVGFLTGLIGVGGGFMIVPALTLVIGAPMKIAVGTSQIIIALNATSAFFGHWGSVEIPWVLVLLFTTAALLGTFVGNRLSHFISAKTLTKIFALFLLLIAAFILLKNRSVFL